MKYSNPSYQAAHQVPVDAEHTEESPIVVLKSKHSAGKKLFSTLVVVSLVAAFGYMITHADTGENGGYSAFLTPSGSDVLEVSVGKDVGPCSQTDLTNLEECLLGHTLTDPNELCTVLKSKAACLPDCKLPTYYENMVGTIPSTFQQECNGEGETGHPKYYYQGQGTCIKGDGTEVQGTATSGVTYIECQVKCMKDTLCTGFSHTVVNDFTYSDCYHYTEKVPMMGNLAPVNGRCYSTEEKRAEVTEELQAKVNAFVEQQAAKKSDEVSMGAAENCVKDGDLCAVDTASDVMNGISGGIGTAGSVVGMLPGAGTVVGGIMGVVSGGIGMAAWINDIAVQCNDCCDSWEYWEGKAWTACGSEPCWNDGDLCGIGTTCNKCCNSHSYWYGKAMTACGREKCWDDGWLCGIGTTCNQCCNGHSYWYGKAMTACGQEPCWKKDTFCLMGTSCNRCCNSYSWWSYCT